MFDRKRILFFVLTCALVLLLCFSVVLKPRYEAETYGIYGTDRLKTVPNANYTITQTENAVSFEMTEAGSWFDLGVNDGEIDVVTVRFASIDCPFGMRMEYCGNGLTVKAALGYNTVEDPLTYTFLMVGGEYDQLRFRFEGNFSIAQIETGHTAKNAVSLQINPIPTILFVVAIVILIVLDKKIGYFRAIAENIRAWTVQIAEDWREKRPAAVLRGGAMLFTTVWVLSVLVQICLKSYSKSSILAIFAFAVAAILFQFAHRIFGNGNGSAASMFLVLALIFGITIAVLLPTSTYVTWDDENHLHRIMEVVSFNHTRSLAEQRLFANSYESTWFIENPRGTVRLIALESVIPGGAVWRGFHPYEFIGYLPAAAVHLFAHLLRVDLITRLVLGRVGFAVVYAGIIWLGLKKIKSGAYIVATICLLPSALFLASSYSYDSWLTAWVAYAFCYLLSEWQNPTKKIQIRDMIFMDGALFLACGPKALYFLLFFPLFFFKKDKFSFPIQRKRFFFATAGIMLLILATFLLPFVIKTGLYSDARGGQGIDAAEQIRFIFSEPLRYTKILINFLGFYVSGQQAQSFNTMFGYLGAPHIFWGTLSALLMIYAMCTDRKENDFYETMRIPRLVTILSAFATLACAATSLYISFTPVGYETVLGCQFRYLFPILIPLSLFAIPSKMYSKISQKTQNLVIFGLLFLNLTATFAEVYLTKL